MVAKRNSVRFIRGRKKRPHYNQSLTFTTGKFVIAGEVWFTGFTRIDKINIIKRALKRALLEHLRGKTL